MHSKYSFVLVCFILLVSCVFAQDGGIEIEFLKPDAGITYEKGQTIELEVRVTYPEGSTDQSVEAYTAAREGEMEMIDLTKNAEGNYTAEIEITYEMGPILHIGIFANAETTEGRLHVNEDIRLSLEQTAVSIDFELIPPEPYYLGTTIEKIKIDAFYPDGSRVPLGNLGSPRLRIGRQFERLDLREDENGSLVAELNVPIEPNEELISRGYNVLEFELLDIDTARGVQKDFEINDEHPSLKLRIKNPSGNERLFHNIEIPFEIELTKAEDVENEIVYLTDIQDLTNKRECQKVEEEGNKLKFQCEERIPSMEETRRIYYVALATADIAGRRITVYEITENEIGNTVYLDLKFPQERETIPLDEIENVVKVTFGYGTAGKLEGGAYSGTINNTPVEFVWSPEEEAYVAEFDLKSLGEGEHELEFSVEGLDLEDDTIRVNFVAPGFFDFGTDGFGGFDPLIMIGAIIAILAIFTFIVWFLVLRKKREETIDKLKEEEALLKELLKRIEIDYYKRRLSEAEYKKRALEYRTRLEKITTKIKAKGIREKEKQKAKK